MSDADILSLVALMYAGRDWHKLNNSEQEIVKHLESAGYIRTSKNPGFTGIAAT